MVKGILPLSPQAGHGDLPGASEDETRWAELDLRSLAVARVVMGLFVLLTVAQNAWDLEAFFTDQGVLPRQVLLGSSFANEWFCFHLGTGGLDTPLALSVLLALFAFGLVLGWRTPWMVFGCWVLLNSMQVRNPFICDRGDLQLSLMLFWGFFLPLGDRWSWDARRAGGGGCFPSARGVAAASLVVQFGLIYLFAAYHKNGPFWLGRGDGLEHSLISPLFATPLSLWLAEVAAPWLPALNYLVIAGELFVALLLFCPWSVPITRGLAVATLLIFHSAIGLIFGLGLFPWIGALMPLALLPREFWTGWGQALGRALDRRFGGESPATRSPQTVSRGVARARDVGLACCLWLAVASNLATIWPGAVPAIVTGAAQALRLSQHWELFSPIPPYYGSFRLQGQKEDGTAITLFAGPPTREEPSLSPFPSHRFRMLMASSLYPQFALVRPGLVRILARRSGQGEPVFYGFEVRIPDAKGRFQPPTTWRLWSRAESDGAAPTVEATR